MFSSGWYFYFYVSKTRILRPPFGHVCFWQVTTSTAGFWSSTGFSGDCCTQVWREELRAAEECGSAGSETRHEAWRRLMFHGYKVLCLPGYEWTKHSDLKSTFTQTLSLLDENRSRPVCCNSNSWTEQQSRVITERPPVQNIRNRLKIKRFDHLYQVIDLCAAC